MEDYCQPVAESFNCSTDLCQFNCECLVMKQKVLSKGNLLQTTSPTVFTSVPATSKKNKYSLHDIRLLRCFNPTCKKPKSNMAKVFHHICFMHMLKTNNEAEKMDMIGISSAHDSILDFVGDHIDISCLKEFSSYDLTNLTFPFCGQRCYNYIINHRDKAKTTSGGVSEYATTQSWESDGSSKKKDINPSAYQLVHHRGKL